MATTTNFGWETPDDSDLVKDGAAAMRTLGNSIDASMADLRGGTTGQILSKNSNTDMDFTWIANDQGDITAVTAGTGISGGGTSGAVTITNSMATEITAAGDIIIGTGSGTFDNLPIGTTGQVLTADTTVSPYKVKWAAVSGASVVGFVCMPLPQYVNFSNNTQAALSFDATDYFDSDNFHSTTTNPERITIPTGLGGKYWVSIGVQWNGQTSGLVDVMLYKNTSLQYTFRWEGAGSVNQDIQIGGSQLIEVVAGDYLKVEIYQTSGGTVGCWGMNNGGGRSTFISGYRLGA